MPLKALILVNAYASNLYTRQVKRMAEELTARGVEVDARRNGFFPFVTGERAAPDCDFCVYLDKDKYTAEMLEKRGIRLFNSARAIAVCDDKMLTHIALEDADVPMPDTMPGLLCYYPDAVPDKSYLDEAEKRLGYPMIVKQSYGSQGNGVFKADTREELNALAQKVKLYPHLFQRFIAGSYGKDMRVIVIGGEVVGGMIRSSDTDFRSNIGLGGKAEKCDVPPDIADIARRAAAALGLYYCGIDFLLSPAPLVCEVNSNAFFDAFEAATGINVAAKYADYILSVMRATRK